MSPRYKYEGRDFWIREVNYDSGKQWVFTHIPDGLECCESVTLKILTRYYSLRLKFWLTLLADQTLDIQEGDEIEVTYDGRQPVIGQLRSNTGNGSDLLFIRPPPYKKPPY